MDNWAEEFHREQQQPVVPGMHSLALDAETEAQFDRAFQEAQQVSDWSNEFRQHVTKEIHTATDGEALAMVADSINGSMHQTSDPRFQSSKFLGMMKQIAQGNVTVSGNSLVESNGLAGLRYQGDWAQEFQGQIAKPWDQEFEQFEATTQLHNQFDNQSNGPQSWDQEFREMEADQVPAETGTVDWEEEYRKQLAETGIFDLGKIDWADDYPLNVAELEGPQVVDQWEKEYENIKNNPGLMNEFDQQDLQDFQQIWEETASASLQGPASSSMYLFIKNNPYLDAPDSFLKDYASHRNLAESILCLEATVQRYPKDAEAWYLLGIRQQENENEASAIAALRTCVESDQDYQSGWLSLSVSYANENMRNDAYDALEKWILRNPKYQGIPMKTTNAFDSSASRHERIVEMYLAAVRQSKEIDPSVQTALGIAFNLSGEYEKAVDCFKAALSIKPEEYLLWNKLGASYANSHQTKEAIDAYNHALAINPSYIRTKYNLAISSIHEQNYKAAAGHVIEALMIHETNIEQLQQNFGDVIGLQRDLDSETLWNSIKTIVLGYLGRSDLALAVENKDLSVLKREI